MYTRMLLLLGVLLPCVLAACPPSSCESGLYTCPTEYPPCSNGELRRRGSGDCGCCPLCIVTIGEGDADCFTCAPGFYPCYPDYYYRMCGEGLTCNYRSRQCERSVGKRQVPQTCAERLDRILRQYGEHLPLGLFIPRCDPDGSYSPVQIREMFAYCVMPDGARIDGYRAKHHFEGMNCECARAKEAVRVSGLIGVMYRCSANGNYEPIQCTGSVCYCVDQTGSRVGNDTVPIGAIDSLNC